MHKFSIRHCLSRIKEVFLLPSLWTTVLFFICTPIKAEEITLPYINTEIRFQSLDIYDGLSQSYVYDIIQDKQGFIWVATGDGLNRYDGNEFVHYRSDVFT